MRKTQQLWQALERVPGLAAVPAEWREHLGDEWDVAQSLLRPRQDLATSVPCPSVPKCECAHSVVTHAPNDIVAVCRCQPRRCETAPLKHSDIVVYEVDRKTIGAAAAAALDAEVGWERVDGIPMTWWIGTYVPLAGYRFPVYLTIQLEAREFQGAISELVAGGDQAFIVTAPTSELCKPVCEELLSKRGACFFALSDLLVLRPDGEFMADQAPEDTLATFRESILPTQTASASSTEFFPTPADAKWEDVNIRFTDGHTVFVKVLNVSGQYNFTQMGMVNRRTGNPTVQWELLRGLADRDGSMDWSSPHADSKNQKRKENLAQALKAFFRIDGEPIRLTPDGKGWRTRFSLSPEA